MLNQVALRKLLLRVCVQLRRSAERIQLEVIANPGTISLPVRDLGKRCVNVECFIVEQKASLRDRDIFDRYCFRIVNRQDLRIRFVDAQPLPSPSADYLFDCFIFEGNGVIDDTPRYFKLTHENLSRGLFTSRL